MFFFFRNIFIFSSNCIELKSVQHKNYIIYLYCLLPTLTWQVLVEDLRGNDFTATVTENTTNFEISVKVK